MPKKSSKKGPKVEPVIVGMKVQIFYDGIIPGGGQIAPGTVGKVIAKNRDDYTVEVYEGASIHLQRKHICICK